MYDDLFPYVWLYDDENELRLSDQVLLACIYFLEAPSLHSTSSNRPSCQSAFEPYVK